MELFEAVQTYFQTQPANQLVALAILGVLMLTFELSASQSYKSSNKLIITSIKKVNKWPGRVIKIFWVVVAYVFAENLWVGAGVAITTTLLVLFQLPGVYHLMVLCIPTITEEEKREVDRGVQYI
jgi:choline-glycine betaine transporter